jgi:hypothetical protein
MTKQKGAVAFPILIASAAPGFGADRFEEGSCSVAIQVFNASKRAAKALAGCRRQR